MRSFLHWNSSARAQGGSVAAVTALSRFVAKQRRWSFLVFPLLPYGSGRGLCRLNYIYNAHLDCDF